MNKAKFQITRLEEPGFEVEETVPKIDEAMLRADLEENKDIDSASVSSEGSSSSSSDEDELNKDLLCSAVK